MKKWQIINIVALVATLAVNGLANYLPLNGQTTGEISDSIPTLFTPAGYVFSIWGLIYLGLAVFVWYQAVPARRETDLLVRIGPWFALSCALNTVWVLLWHWELFALTEVVMVGLLVSLIAVYLRLGIGRREASTSEKWLVHAPFSTYLGWISVATIANTSVLLYTLKWNGWGIPVEVWTILVIIVAAGLGIVMALLRGEIAYPLVIVWAAIGIVVARQDIPAVAITAGICATVVVIVLVLYRIVGLTKSAGVRA